MAWTVGDRLGHKEATALVPTTVARRTWVVAMVVWALLGSPAFAQSPSLGRGTQTVVQPTVNRLVPEVDLDRHPARFIPIAQTVRPQGSWITRHPVWFGAIVGAITGASIVGATSGAEAAFVGFYGGGAAGAVVGWAVSR